MPLSQPQITIAKSNARFRVVIAGRRFGKSILSIRELCKFGSHPHRNIFYVAPTYKQCKNIIWRKLKNKLHSLNWIKSTNETELSIELHNQTRISLHGADSPDSLRGEGVHFLVMDEFAQIADEAFYEILRPMLSDTNGHALFISTPLGKANWAYEMYQMRDEHEDWDSFRYSTEEGGFVDESEIREARMLLDRKTFAQEYLADFTSSQNVIAYDFDKELSHTSATLQPREPIYIGLDLNVNVMPAAIYVLRNNIPHFVAEMQGDRNTQTLIHHLDSRFRGHPKTIYPDATSVAEKTSASSSDLAQLRFAFGSRNVITGKKNPLVETRISALNSQICNVNNLRRLFVNTHECPLITKALEEQPYNNANKPDKTYKLNDMFDAISYGIFYRFGIKKAQIRVT